MTEGIVAINDGQIEVYSGDDDIQLLLDNYDSYDSVLVGVELGDDDDDDDEPITTRKSGR